MHIRRSVALCVALVLLGGWSPSLLAQKADKKAPEKRTKQEQADIDALLRLVDAPGGSPAAGGDVGITWESNHFFKSADGNTYVPFTVAVDRAKLASPGVAVYVRAVSKDAAAAPAKVGDKKGDDKKGDKAPEFPWATAFFSEIRSDGTLSRGMALPGGEYDVIVGLKDRTTGEKNQPPAKMGLLRHTLTVPDFKKTDLGTSSILMGSVEPIAAPLSPAQQQENPYAFGNMKVSPSKDGKLSKSGELSLLFWIYGAANDPATSKPNVTVEFSFHQKTADGEKYFNKTAPQELNAQTLPPEFSLAAGHQLPGSLAVPLASFPPGDYRVEIKITDKAVNKSTTQNVTFSVLAT